MSHATGISRAVQRRAPLGSVAFVGLGPGDHRLLTIQVREALDSADIIFHESDNWVVSALTRGKLAREDVDIRSIDGDQSATNRAKELLAAAKTGAKVLRVVSGDPSLSARVAAELSICLKAGVATELMPGIASHSTIPAFAGVPLSGKVQDIRILNAGDIDQDWSSIASSPTLVLSGVRKELVSAAAELLDAGVDPERAVSITASGATTSQQTVVTTLSEVSDAIASLSTEQNLIAVVGDAVRSRNTSSWFETKPLFGWQVLVPRTKEIPGSLDGALRHFGATAIEVPTIGVEPPRTPQQMERAIRGLFSGRYEWVAFTSAHSVQAVWERLDEFGLDARAFAGTKIAVISDEVAQALQQRGIRADLAPTGDHTTAGLLDVFPQFDRTVDPINRIFLPRADIATETLVAGLQELGWEVEDVTAYRTVRAAPPAVEIRDAIKSGGFDAVLFTSSSTVRNLLGIAGKPHHTTVIACIGPATAKTAEEHGLRVDVLASEPDSLLLVEELAAFGECLRSAACESGEGEWRPSRRRPNSRRKQT
jgi:uroporphyrinogen III methyltransferase / synthase